MTRPPITLVSIAGATGLAPTPTFRMFPFGGYDDIHAMPPEHRALVHEWTYEIYDYARQMLQWRGAPVTVDNLKPLIVKFYREAK